LDGLVERDPGLGKRGEREQQKEKYFHAISVAKPYH
jgi:hypothetical protein